MDAFSLYAQQVDVVNAKDKLANIRSACQVLQAKVAELIAMRTAWQALVAAGTYTQADVDALNVQANAAKLAALFTAVNSYMA